MKRMQMKLITIVVRAWLFILRQDMVLGKVNLRRLKRRNQISTESVTRPGGPVVSLTSHGSRLQTVFLTIESIGAGSMLPSRLILWLDDCRELERLPASIKRLEERGLEVRLSDNFGPHTKYYPYVTSMEHKHTPLVTADDDQVYCSWWLRTLAHAHSHYPEVINCFRAHRVRLQGSRIAPYLSWDECKTTKPSFLSFGTGVSGCIYPPRFVGELKEAGPAFRDSCPKADDVWLHVNALRAGFKVRQVFGRPLDFPIIPDTQNSGLFLSNWKDDGNDSQIKATYNAEDTEILYSELKAS